MAITVKHKFVSAIPDGDDTTIVRPSNWNDTHDLTGLGTMAEQNANSVSVTGGTVSNTTLTSDTVSNNLTFTPTTAPSYVEGEIWYDSTQKALTYYNDVTNNQVHIGQEVQLKVINNTGSSIANGTPVYVTGTSSGQSYPNIALAKADAVATSAVLGLTNGTIASGATGYVCTSGLLNPCNTGTFTVGDVLYLSPYSAGQMMNTVPPTGYAVQIGVVAYSNTPNGSIYVKQTTPLAVSAAIITGTVAVANGGTGASTASGARTNLGLGTIATQAASSVAITGGTIDGTTIGATTPAAGTFTTITGQTEVLKGTGQNLITYSQTYTNSAWSTSTATRADNQTTAPDSTSTAGTITSVNTSYGGLLRQSVTLTSTTYTVSAYLKKNNWSYVGFRLGSVGSTDFYPFVNLDTGVTNNQSLTGVTITATSVGSGWYRVSVVAPNTNTGSQNLDIAIVASNGFAGTNNGAGQIAYVWGAQLEIGSTLGTYIPTTTTAVYGTPTLSFSGVAGLGLQSDGSLYVSPAGTGALQAQATTSSTVGGNARGANAVDLSTASKDLATRVASGTNSVITGGQYNTASSTSSVVSGGSGNTASGGSSNNIAGGSNNTASGSQFSTILGGYSNTSSGQWSLIGGGYANTAAGFYNFIGTGYTNSGTSGSAVTTQSATMNATTAVTLAATNANIKVGQLITGTSITTFPATYVAAISGTSLTLSQAASGSSTSTLSFYTPHGVVVGGGNNQATGSYSFIGGGGDAGTAANRNVASGDWSVVVGGRQNTASGGSSFVGGGGVYPGINNIYPNTASGTFSAVVAGGSNNATNEGSFVGGGLLNTANSNYSVIAGGNYGTTRGIIGNAVFPACQYPMASAQGVSQASLLILARQTTDATPTVLASNSSTASTTNQVILPNNSAYYFKGTVVAGVTGAGNTKGWTIEGVIKRGAGVGTTALVGVTVMSSYADVGAATWTIGVTADTTNGGLAVTATGQAATTIRWVCKVETTEMTY